MSNTVIITGWPSRITGCPLTQHWNCSFPGDAHTAVSLISGKVQRIRGPLRCPGVQFAAGVPIAFRSDALSQKLSERVGSHVLARVRQQIGDQGEIPKRMQIFPVIVDNQIVPAFIVRQIFLRRDCRVLHNQNRSVGTINVNKATTDMQRLMNVAEKMNQQLQRVAFAQGMIWIRMYPARCECSRSACERCHGRL